MDFWCIIYGLFIINGFLIQNWSLTIWNLDSKVNRPSKIFIIVHFVAYFVIRPSFHRQPSKQWVPSSMMHIWFYLKNKRRLRSIKRACNTYRVSRKVLDSQNTKIRKVTLLLKISYFKSEIPFGSKFILNQK